jgi:hypothetical protein
MGTCITETKRAKGGKANKTKTSTKHLTLSLGTYTYIGAFTRSRRYLEKLLYMLVCT